MKKAISLIIALCLILCSVVPSFAASDVVVTAFYNGSTNSGINAGQVMQSLLNFIVAINTKLPAVTSTGTVFENIDLRLGHIESWLVPTGSSGTNPSLYQLMLEAGIAFQSYLPYIPTISSYVSSWMTSNNNYLDYIRKGIGHSFGPFAADNGYSLWVDIYNSAHRQLLYANSALTNVPTKMDGTYYLPYIYSDGRYVDNGTSQNWNMGTPIGNIALILKRGMQNDGLAFNYRWNADLKHYNDNLTTWDSQGNTLTQVAFTPESAIQGLYRYLAFTQRDVARLTYVFASDQELLAREQQQDVTDAVTDIFLDSDIGSSTNVGDIDRLGRFSEIANDNFDTGYGLSNISSIFNNDQYINNDGWFTVTTANNLGYYPQTRDLSKSLNNDNLDYPTPLLDSYYNEILSLSGERK